jgi:Tol biopolymer transport system component
VSKSGKKLVALTAVTLGAATMLPAGASSSDTWADNGRIIYISCESGQCDPYTSKEDGTGEKNLLDDAGFEDTPTISDNGKRIAFRHLGEIWVARSDGSDLDNITDSPGVSDTEPDISPDGKSIVYSSFDGSAGDIVRSKIDGTGVKPLLEGSKDDGAPEWSPDGKRIVFERGETSVSTKDVYVMKKDGSDRKQRTDTSQKSEFNPTWSPDGKRIAFSQFMGSGAKLKTIKASGGPMNDVGVNAGAPFVPSYSPDGQRLSFFDFDNGQSDVFTVKLNGKGKRNITHDANTDFFYD